MIKLTITEKGGDSKPLSFDKDEVLIGRVQGNDIVLPKGNISKRHTRLAIAEGRLTVHDLKSTNGTYVNGRKISEPTPVRGGDKIFVGDFLILVDGQAGVAEASGGHSAGAGASSAGAAGSSGARRMPAPPPPPPPPARGGAVGRVTALQMPDESDFSSGLEGKQPTTGRGRTAPPAPPPPPPPPRPTIMSAPLEDDSADIGLGAGAPPSLADVSGDGGGGGDLGVDLGADVFGSSPAPEEDVGPSFGFPATESASRRGAVIPPDAMTPPPASVASQLGRVSVGTTAAEATSGAAMAAAGGEPSTLEALLADAAVTSILVGAGGTLRVERQGKLEPSGTLGEPNAVAEAVWQLASLSQPPPPPDNPVVDVRLADGTRVTALFPPIVAAGAYAAIRKAMPPETALADVAGGSDVEQILTAALASRRNLLVAGDAPAVAAVMGAVAAAIPADRRVVSIGAGVKSRSGWIELAPTGDPGALVRAATAFRGDHLLIAEIGGGAELGDVLLAAARGQEGLVAAMAARSAAEALARLRALSVAALGAPAFPGIVTSTVDLVVVAATSTDGTVRVVEIAEPRAEGDAVAATAVAKRPEAGRGGTALEVIGVSSRLAGAIAAGGGTLAPHLHKN